jgi:hypothetical protein
VHTLCGASERCGQQSEAIWTFEAVAAQTKVTIHLLFPNAQAHNMAVEKIGAIEGGNQTLARLANYVIKIHSRGMA